MPLRRIGDGERQTPVTPTTPTVETVEADDEITEEIAWELSEDWPEG